MLVAGTVVALGVTQSFRSEGTVISAVSSDWRTATQRERGIPLAEVPQGRRLCPGVPRSADIPVSFFLNRDDTVDLAIVNAENGDVRRVLATGLQLDGDRRHCAPWDRRDDAGRRVPPGVYRLRVTLLDADRVATAGEAIRVRSTHRPEPSP